MKYSLVAGGGFESPPLKGESIYFVFWRGGDDS